MATERLAPDAVLDSTNYLSLALASIQDDPDSPDALWGAWDTGNTTCRVSFPSPSGSLTPGAGLQEGRALIRKAGGTGGNLPAWSLELWEAGALISVLASGTVSSETGTVVAGTFDASVLADPSGGAVELLLAQTDGGTGKPAERRGVEVGAIEWNAVYDDAGAVVAGDGAAAGSAATTGETSAFASVDASAAGVSVPAGSAASLSLAAGSGAGSALVASEGAAVHPASGAAAGMAASESDSAVAWSADAWAAGIADAMAESLLLWAAQGSGAGAATASAFAAMLSSAVASGAGAGAVTGVSPSVTSAPRLLACSLSSPAAHAASLSLDTFSASLSEDPMPTVEIN